jgi:hypothetical protein
MHLFAIKSQGEPWSLLGMLTLKASIVYTLEQGSNHLKLPMKTVTESQRNRSFFCILLLAVCPLTALLAQQPGFSIEIRTAFNYPFGTSISTTPHHISSSGDCAATSLDASGATYGFIRSAHGDFSAPLVDPNDDAGYTYFGGIDSSRTASGYYFNSAEGHYHGFFWADGVFSAYDAPNATDTFLLDNNDLGDFCGYVYFSPTSEAPFVFVAGLFDQFGFSPAGPIHANGLNGRQQVVGDYVDFFSPTVVHGFFYDYPRFVITRPLDFPGSTSTSFKSVNDQGVMVGSYLDGSGGEHGLFFKLPDKYVAYDFPGASATSLNGISNSNFVTGQYTDGFGTHGFIGRIRFQP